MMKRILLLLAFLPMFVYADDFSVVRKEKVFIGEMQPSFPGGQAALMKYISENIKYPVDAEKKGIQGRVLVAFFVESDGSITDVRVAKSVHPLLDREAVRVVEGMPRWIPGELYGKPVRVKFMLPVTFRLPDKSSEKESKKIFIEYEEMPSFPGGQAALMKYISKNMRYPAVAEKEGIQGRVVVAFSVESDGSITNVRVAKSVHPLLDREAVRVVEGMPRWIPGKLCGKPVRVKYTIPVTFGL